MDDIKYRAVKSNDSDDVIAIGADENQGGKSYNDGMGTWCTFTFDKLPEPTDEIKEYIKNKELKSTIYKIQDNKIMCKNIYEIY